MSSVPTPHLSSVSLRPAPADSLSHSAKGMSVRLHVAAGVAALLAVLGLASISSTVFSLWALWTTDALKSIGMMIPVVSFFLVLRAWRSIGWEMEGSWSGFALLIATTLLVRLRDQSVLILLLSPQWSVYFPPHSLILFLYGVGVTLLFGGVRLCRAAVFPLVLLLFANPVPHVFNAYVDLPLQRASAHVARGLAQALGQPLTQDKLRLMFTPDFGMFIAPGCNGVRGAVTMAFIALIIGHLYRFRWQVLAVVVACATLLGYLFNFLRLCVLVLFYFLALRFTSLQEKMKNIDYAIGATLFFCAVFLLYTVVQRLGESRAASVPAPPSKQPAPFRSRRFYTRAAAMTLLAALSIAATVHKLAAQPSAALLAADRQMGHFPETIGPYTRVRTWNEDLSPGTLLFHWAEYSRSDGTPHVSIGISPVLGSHDTLICHSARGEDPIWHGQQTIATASEPVNFNTSLFNNGATQSLEVTTLCNASACGEFATANAHFGFVWSKPHPERLFSLDAQRPIPILLKTETLDATLPAAIARQQLSANVAAFLAHANLDALTQPYRRP